MPICSWCSKPFEGEDYYHSCIDCANERANRQPSRTAVAPIKGSPEWYKGKWWKKNDKEWHADIRSRKTIAPGVLARFNDRGERIA